MTTTASTMFRSVFLSPSSSKRSEAEAHDFSGFFGDAQELYSYGGDFIVHIHAARGLRPADANGLSDPYCVLLVGGVEVGRTPHHPKTLDPMWDCELRVPFRVLQQAADRGARPIPLEPIILQLWDKDYGTKDDPLGCARIWPDVTCAGGGGGEDHLGSGYGGYGSSDGSFGGYGSSDGGYGGYGSSDGSENGSSGYSGGGGGVGSACSGGGSCAGSAGGSGEGEGGGSGRWRKLVNMHPSDVVNSAITGEVFVSCHWDFGDAGAIAAGGGAAGADPAGFGDPGGGDGAEGVPRAAGAPHRRIPLRRRFDPERNWAHLYGGTGAAPQLAPAAGPETVLDLREGVCRWDDGGGTGGGSKGGGGSSSGGAGGAGAGGTSGANNIDGPSDGVGGPSSGDGSVGSGGSSVAGPCGYFSYSGGGGGGGGRGGGSAPVVEGTLVLTELRLLFVPKCDGAAQPAYQLHHTVQVLLPALRTLTHRSAPSGSGAVSGTRILTAATREGRILHFLIPPADVAPPSVFIPAVANGSCGGSPVSPGCRADGIGSPALGTPTGGDAGCASSFGGYSVHRDWAAGLFSRVVPADRWCERVVEELQWRRAGNDFMVRWAAVCRDAPPPICCPAFSAPVSPILERQQTKAAVTAATNVAAADGVAGACAESPSLVSLVFDVLYWWRECGKSSSCGCGNCSVADRSSENANGGGNFDGRCSVASKTVNSGAATSGPTAASTAAATTTTTVSAASAAARTAAVVTSSASPPRRATRYNVEMELKRFGAGVPGSRWRLSYANADYRLVPSYPRVLAFPAAAADDHLKPAAAHRSKRRLPTLTWLHWATGAPLVRSAQPMTGLSQRVLIEDIALLTKIRETAATTKKLSIIDARPLLNARANQIGGKGFEDVEDLGGKAHVQLHFMSVDIDNIHVMRESLTALSAACHARGVDFHAAVGASGWLRHISQARARSPHILRSALFVANRLQGGWAVLVHCSDGWDRTAQLTSLAQVILDPYYRTAAGFEVLVEKEWCSFGHMFEWRCMSDGAESSPVFLQFVDAVGQLLDQFPEAFEFAPHFLLCLVDAAYGGIFGTFHGNCEADRAGGRGLNAFEYISRYCGGHPSLPLRNRLYRPPEADRAAMLRPCCDAQGLVLWRDLYLRGSVILTHRGRQLPRGHSLEAQLRRPAVPAAKQSVAAVATATAVVAMTAAAAIFALAAEAFRVLCDGRRGHSWIF
ncbi:unnamed protein product [Phaeothamnion confervicola]